LENLKKNLDKKYKNNVYQEIEDEEVSLDREEKDEIEQPIDKNKETKLLMNKLHSSIQQIEMYGIKASIRIKSDAEKSKIKRERGMLISKNLVESNNNGSQNDVVSIFEKKSVANKLTSIEKEKESKVVFHPNKFDYFVKQKQKKFKGEFAIKDEEMRDKIYELSENGHFGPYTSFCNNCNRKNINFYNFIEKKTGVDILDNMLHPRKLK
jgi:hypothetical protein